MSGPVAAQGRYPFIGHRNMATVIADEEYELAMTASCWCSALVGQPCISTRGTEAFAPHSSRLERARRLIAEGEQVA